MSGVIAPETGKAGTDLDRQLELLEHRGPDAHGHFDTGSGAAIGQNRLAIIDLVTGDPPITNEDRTVAVVLNGEIYNFRELRDGAGGRGHEFGSRGDTEVIAHLAEELDAGRARPQRSTACSPSRSGTSAAAGSCSAATASARSRSTTGTAAGGSCSPARSRRCSPTRACRGGSTRSAIPAYLTFGYVPTPRTFFEGIRSLPPGHVLTFEPGGEPVIERYWEPPVAGDGRRPALDISLDEAAARGPLDCLERRGRAAARSPTCRSARSSAAASTRARWSAIDGRR